MLTSERQLRAQFSSFIIGKEKLSYLLCLHFYALEFGFLNIPEKLTLAMVRGQLTFAVGNTRALGSAHEGPRHIDSYLDGVIEEL